MNLDQIYVINPSLIVEETSPKLIICLPSTKQRISIRSEMIGLLDFFEEPNSLKQAKDAFSIASDVIQFLVNKTIIVPVKDIKLYRYGLLEPSSHSIGFPLKLSELYPKQQERWCVFGAPISFSSKKNRVYSPNGGVQAIRSSLSLFNIDERIPTHEEPPSSQFCIRDWNHHEDVSINEAFPFDLGDLCYDLRFESQKDVFEKIHYIVKRIGDVGGKPLVLGGDHSISKPILDSLLSKHDHLTIVHLDAHTDRYVDSLTNKTGLTNGVVFQQVMDHPNFHRLVQLGVHEFEYIQTNHTEDFRCTVISAYDFQEDPMKQLLDSLELKSPIYLSVDADVFDPIYAPEVEWPVMGGLTYFQVYQIVEYLVTHYQIIGADFVEVCGSDSSRNMAASCMSNLVTLLILNQKEKGL